MTEHFDRQLSLRDLFTEKDIVDIELALSGLLGLSLTVAQAGSQEQPGFERAAISWDLEPIGYVVMKEGHGKQQLQAAVSLFNLLVKNAARYRMAKDIHQEVVSLDYESLQKKHQALLESETRYKELAQQLEQKVAEQVQTIQVGQTRLYQAEKQASVGQLAAGMAHEMNNPLAYVQNNIFSAVSYLESLQAIQEEVKKKDWTALKKVWEEEDVDFILEDFPALMADSLEGIKKVTAIVADLKIFSDIDRTEMAFDDINNRLKTVLSVLRSRIPETIEVVSDFGQLPPLSCDPALIGQVFYNIFENCIQAIDGAGKICIHTAMAGEAIQITIRDTGKGIEPEHQSRIFDPFFTTREIGEGTGLGLAVCHDIIKAHGGSISVESGPKSGTTFTITLPLEQYQPQSVEIS